jgi:hypothetical protein
MKKFTVFAALFAVVLTASTYAKVVTEPVDVYAKTDAAKATPIALTKVAMWKENWAKGGKGLGGLVAGAVKKGLTGEEENQLSEALLLDVENQITKAFADAGTPLLPKATVMENKVYKKLKKGQVGDLYESFTAGGNVNHDLIKAKGGLKKLAKSLGAKRFVAVEFVIDKKMDRLASVGNSGIFYPTVKLQVIFYNEKGVQTSWTTYTATGSEPITVVAQVYDAPTFMNAVQTLSNVVVADFINDYTGQPLADGARRTWPYRGDGKLHRVIREGLDVLDKAWNKAVEAVVGE